VVFLLRSISNKSLVQLHISTLPVCNVNKSMLKSDTQADNYTIMPNRQVISPAADRENS